MARRQSPKGKVETIVRRELKLIIQQHLHIGMADVEAVPFIRAQHDGEFAAIVLANLGIGPDMATLMDFLTAPGSRIDVTRVHPGKYATRVYIRALAGVES